LSTPLLGNFYLFLLDSFLCLFELGNAEKGGSGLSKSDKLEVNVHQKPSGFVSGKDVNTVNVSDPPVPFQCVKRENSNDAEGDSFIAANDGCGIPTDTPEVLPTPSDATVPESDLRDIVPQVGVVVDSASKFVGCEQKPLESTVNNCRVVGVAEASDDTLPDISHGFQMIHNRYPTDNKLDKPNLKQEAYPDQSTTENPSGDLVIPEQSYIWQYDLSLSFFTPLISYDVFKCRFLLFQG
jgi:hypothetical protein